MCWLSLQCESRSGYSNIFIVFLPLKAETGSMTFPPDVKATHRRQDLTLPFYLMRPLESKELQLEL